MFSDRNDERHLHLGQKLDDVPGVELSVKAEYFDLQAEFSDLVETLGDVPDLGDPLTYRIDSQRHLPVFCGHVEGDVGIKLICRLFASLRTM